VKKVGEQLKKQAHTENFPNLKKGLFKIYVYITMK